MGDGPTPPAYLGVMNELRARINTMPPETALPAITKLAAEYGTSYGIVRRALEKLRDSEGLLTSQQGQRFYTATPPLELEHDTLGEIMQRFDEICAELRTLEGRIAQLETDRRARADAPAPTGLRSRRRPQQTSP